MTDKAEKIFAGISSPQMEHHIKQQYIHELAQKRQIEARLIRAETICVNDTYCQLRSLKKEFVYSTNSIRLHEYYFQNAGSVPVERPPLVTVVLSRDFGSFEEWQDQFEALGQCARGWVLAGYDLKEGRVQNYITDSHEEGVWAVVPVLVLDVFEHAYYPQFKTRREYIKAFLNSVDWAVVGKRLRVAIDLYSMTRSIFK